MPLSGKIRMLSGESIGNKINLAALSTGPVTRQTITGNLFSTVYVHNGTRACNIDSRTTLS